LTLHRYAIIFFIVITCNSILVQADYINTSHPNFIGGSKAVEQAQQQVRSSRLAAVARREGVDADKSQASDKTQKPRALLGRTGVNGVVTDHLQVFVITIFFTLAMSIIVRHLHLAFLLLILSSTIRVYGLLLRLRGQDLQV
jgi:hypothetical protein